MKLCTFIPSAGPTERSPSATGPHSPTTRPRLGALSPLDPDTIIDLGTAFGVAALPPVDGFVTDAQGVPHPLTSMQACLDAGDAGFDLVRRVLEVASDVAGEHRIPRSQVSLLAPLPRPRSIRDAMAFERHFLQARQGGALIKFPPIGKLDRVLRRTIGLSLIGIPRRYREIPAYYKGNPATVVGDGATVVWPEYTRLLDYELEIGFYILRQGRDLRPGDAPAHIAGYTIFNDFSARDIQIREMDLGLGPAKGKDFDTGNAMGPFLVTPDEVGDPCALKAIARVNGEVWTDSSTRAPQFTPAEIVSYISRSETLYPGDFIGLGTVPDGCGLEHGRWLKPGDDVCLEVENLGTLTNRVARAPETSQPGETAQGLAQ